MSPLDDPVVLGLLGRAREGDLEAWNALVIEQLGRLRRLARLLLDSRLVARFDPEDVVQEALADSFLMRERFFADVVPFSSWLRVRLSDRVHRLHRDHLATQGRSVAREAGRASGGDLDPIGLAQDPGSSPSRRAMRVEERLLLHSVFRDLREIDREILGMIYFEARDYREIAIILDLEIEAVKKRHERALARLTTLLRKAHPEWCHAHETDFRPRT